MAKYLAWIALVIAVLVGLNELLSFGVALTWEVVGVAVAIILVALNQTGVVKRG